MTNNFQTYWERIVKANPHGFKKVCMTHESFKRQLEKAYNAGAHDTALVSEELAKIKTNDMPDFFKGFFH